MIKVSEVFLKMENISKSFNKIKVLKEVNFELRKGEIHALVGGNGAGKSTLMKILTGVYKKDSGKILINGTKVEINEPKDAKANGIAMVFQEFSLVPTLTIAQNIFLNQEPKSRLGFIDDKKCLKRAQALLNNLNIDVPPAETIDKYSVAYWQLFEIAKALSYNSKILIMDEPTSSLSESETEILFDFMKQLKDKGISIIYISHRMEEVLKIADRVTILRNGENVLTENSSNLTLEQIIENIVGRELEHSFEWQKREIGRKEPILKVKNLNSKRYNLKNISFELYPGEILGIAGLMGSGRTEIVESLFGIKSYDSGEIMINNKKVGIESPQEALREGLALVPENRRTQGLILDHSVKNNILLPILKKLKGKLFINDKEGRNITEKLIETMSIKTDGINQKVKFLSGGNQQKVVIGKWIAHQPEIFLMDEPTIGVDIGAKTEIIELIRSLANENKAIIIISSELQELMAISDRIIVLKNGSISRTINREDIFSEEELQYAIQKG
ncbi:sugar ABC transporter ATP-binding protein [Petrotoga halophila]|uniref:Sugar ABC transporter ATP-binding protein n=1 Tax=Petrotoga halophila DSM 16923 TaxID=1122953 RepID=A0A2S5EKB0_9BACT|nr:sugar ABC transporter ATP-binding protein [Petrotoga halophila DSM 16923]